jgi:hypothetical protein
MILSFMIGWKKGGPCDGQKPCERVLCSLASLA